VGGYFGGGGEASFSSSTCCENKALYNVKMLTVCGGVGIGIELKGVPPIGISAGGISLKNWLPSHTILLQA
jgi:hypothetical protein